MTSYTQAVTPTPVIPAEEGMCLQYVRQSYGLPLRYSSATEAWEKSTSQHRDRDYPQGVWFPLWYGLEKNVNGHVVNVAPDGTVWSTSDRDPHPLHHHPSIADLEAYYSRYDMPLVYRGWTEDVAGYPVITPTASEEDDLALFENETVFRDKVISAVFDARFDTRDETNKVTGTTSLRDMLTYYGANIAMDRRQLRDGLAAAVKTVATAVKEGQAVDPDKIAAEIIDNLQGMTLTVVASKAG